MSEQPNKSPLANYIGLLVQLHRLIAAGKGDSKEADDVRDEMDGPRAHLSDPDLRLTDKLAEDLYHLDLAETFDNVGPARALIDLHLLELADVDQSLEGERLRTILEEWWSRSDLHVRELISGLSADLRLLGNEHSQAAAAPDVVSEAFTLATRNHDWSRALSVLREHGDKVPPVELAAMLGICWDNLGYREVASVFFGDALQRMPKSIALQALYFRSLLRTGQFAAAKANALFLAQSSASPYSSLLAADILLQCAMQSRGGPPAVSELKLVVDLVERAPVEAMLAERHPLLRSIAFTGYLSARRAYETLGEKSRAEEVHRIAMSLRDGDADSMHHKHRWHDDVVLDLRQQRQFVDSNLMAVVGTLTSHPISHCP